MNSYFDYNATTPLSPAAREAWMEAADVFWHNPSSLYREAGAARRRLEDARESLADRLGADPERVVFTSGATEANCGVMAWIAGLNAGVEAGVVISAIEHPSVREPARRFFGRERCSEISFDSPDTLLERLNADHPPVLVSAMAANNETGVLQDWKTAASACRDRGVPFHCDAAQWIGKMPSITEFGERCDFVTGCAHKFGGPRGVGFLLIPQYLVGKFHLQVGGPQEGGHRAGTEDLPGIVAMLVALEEKNDAWLFENGDRWLADRIWFEREIMETIPGTMIVAPEAERLWNTVMLVMPRHPNLKWLTRLSASGFAVSTGSACSAGKGNPSHVMEAMGLDHDQMGRVLRISAGWDTRDSDWRALAESLTEISDQLDSGVRSVGRGILGG